MPTSQPSLSGSGPSLRPSTRVGDAVDWTAAPRSGSMSLLDRVDQRLREVSEQLDASSRARLGQFFTPSAVSTLIASLPVLPESGLVKILDPGAGIGALTASMLTRIIDERPDLEVEVTLIELDEKLLPELTKTVAACEALADQAGTTLRCQIVAGDFLDWAANAAGTLPLYGEPVRFDLVIMNPPYRKVNTDGPERSALRGLNVEVTNLYVAFLALATALLDEGGQIAAITPRSFANGPYFRSFRQFFFERMSFRRLHVFDSRSSAFSDDAVLQENVIFAVGDVRTYGRPDVIVSSSHGPDAATVNRFVAHAEIVHPDDPDRVVHIVTDDRHAPIASRLRGLPTSLRGLGIEVSTGKVVDFRARQYLLDEPAEGSVPLIYPGNLREQEIDWPKALRRKPIAIVQCDATRSLLLPVETYVLVKRFTSKEERRRVVAAVFRPDDVPGESVAFENHLNVFHVRGHGLDPEIADGLAAWLNSSLVDCYVRTFNGHTQINATDLRMLRYPTLAQLHALGSAVGAGGADQEKIDSLISEHVEELVDISL